MDSSINSLALKSTRIVVLSPWDNTELHVPIASDLCPLCRPPCLIQVGLGVAQNVNPTVTDVAMAKTPSENAESDKGI